MSDAKLQPIDDGLPARKSQDYARMKLKALTYYLHIVTKSMHKKWPNMVYLDLQSGPGKNQIRSDFLLGSPLIALTLEVPFTHYYFNELDKDHLEALQTRVAASELRDRVRFYQQDINEVVFEICSEIEKRESLNVAFIDPEGLEVRWSTIERLARVRRMDLIINFSTSGLDRSAGADNESVIDRFYGNTSWRPDMQISDPTRRRRALIERYLSQLSFFGYYIEENPEIEHLDISFRNSKNSEVYRLIFASKNKLGNEFWQKTRRGINPPRLPGL